MQRYEQENKELRKTIERLKAEADDRAKFGNHLEDIITKVCGVLTAEQVAELLKFY